MAEQQHQSAAAGAMDWVLKNKLKAVIYTWATGVSGSLLYQWSRPIPTSLKIIHSRVYAQAITLAALGGVAAVELFAKNGAAAAEKSAEGL